MFNSTFKPRAKPMTRCVSPGTAKLTVKEKTRKCAVKTCRTEFRTFSTFVKWCSHECGAALAMAALEKKKQKEQAAERKEFRARKEAAMPLKKRLKATEKVMNLYVRIRDWHEGCCSCDKPAHWDGQWHASHFKSVGSNSLLRFHLWNIYKGCSECNRHRAGNIAEYTKRLELRFGAERVEWLENRKNGTRKYTAEYLDRMRKIFTKKARRAKLRLQANEGVAA